MSIWREEMLGNKLPEQFQKLNDNDYIQRKNIRIDDRDMGNENNEVRYICESRIIDKKTYEDLMAALESPAQKQLIENQKNEKSNQLSLMEAIADLYDLILSTQEVLE